MRSLRTFFRFLLQVQGAVVLGARINRDEDAVEVLVRRHGNAKARCCIHPKEVLTGTYTTTSVRWRHLDLMKRRTYLVADIREGRCPLCNGRRHEAVPWAGPRARHTRSFDRHVASLAQVADRSAASRMFHVTWRTVGRIVKRVVDEFLPRDLLDNLECIGVDETSYKRGHRYITVVTDLMTGVVVWVGKGKTAETLGEFFKILGPERAAKIGLVTMDMGGAFQKAVKKWAPNADIVFDRFHVVKLLLEAIDEIRRGECGALDGDAKKALKNTRFALLRNPKHRKPKDNEAISRVKATNGRLHRAYQLRVDFEDLWEIHDEDEARGFLMRWTRSALLSRREPLRKFARTVREHIDGILGFMRWEGITNANLEGMANKIKLCIHKAFGFHSVDSLIGMVHLCCSGISLV